ncbi:hypothetical protein ACFE04_030731 [Oxalis oulophora]
MGFCYFFITLPFLVKVVLSLDSNYTACEPRNCSTGPNVSYPFYISDVGAESCGFRAFRVVCKDGKPIYQTSRSDYIIKDISYANHSFRLVHYSPVVSDSCYAPLDYFAFDRSSEDFSPNHADLLFFYNCSDSFSANTTTLRIPCAYGQVNNSYVVLDIKDSVKSNGDDTCGSTVAAPVELEGGLNLNNYVELLENGFILTWNDLGFDCI